MSDSQCILCLVGNIKMHCIDKTGLKELYEKVTSTKLNSDDSRPNTLCYICCFQLQRCYKFAEMSQRAEKIITDLKNNGLEVTPQILTMLNLGLSHNLNITATVRTSINFNYQSPKVTVKEEIIEDDAPTVVETKSQTVELSSSICRVCLASRGRMQCIQSCLADTFEKVTSTKLNTEDGRPVTFCYICLSQLKRCHRVSEMSLKTLAFFLLGSRVKTEKISNDYNDTKVPMTALNLNLEMAHNLVVKTTQMVTPHDYIKNTAVTVKMEFKVEAEETAGVMNITVTAKNQDGHYVCHICSKSYKAKLSLVEHILSSHSSSPKKMNYICTHCSKTFHDKGVLKRHFLTHTRVKPYICIHCKQSFTFNSALKQHITRIHSVPKLFVCGLCNKAYFEKHVLKRHMIRHTGVKEYQCNICDKAYFDKHNYDKHIRIHTGSKPFACDMCDKKFSDKSNMIRHLKIHSGFKPIKCNQCSATFTTNYSLKQHIRIHTGIKPYICNVCSKAYFTKFRLCKHMITHTRHYTPTPTEFKCSDCDKVFDQKINLRQHIKRTHAIKPHVCGTCGKAFSSPGPLKSHERTHTGEKPFGCSECDRKFTASKSLQNHMIKHGDRKHACSLCSKKYHYKSALNEHMKCHKK